MNEEKIKIKETENGYWISDDWLYLDSKEFKIDKNIEFNEFSRCFRLPLKYDKEWKGNNPFSKSSCLRYWLENEKSMVEICVFTYEKETEIIIHKVVTEAESSKELIKDLLDLEELYRDVLVSFDSYLHEEVYIDEGR